MEGRRWLRGGCVGKGSFGTVSLALDPANGWIFAVKSVCLNSAPPRAIAALENEIRLLSSLDSPHVIGYLGEDVTEEPSHGGRCRNLHLEYLPHGTLADAAATRKLGENEMRNYARSIARALQYLHFTAGVVHGDIKGRNVLLGSAPKTARLSDFGSARRLSDVSAEVRGSGTALWMAPEVARGEAVTPASDVWSLGCTVIEIADRARRPWGELGSNSNATAQMYRIGFGEGVPKFPVGLSWAARDFLDKCLKRDPTERWTCEQLLQHSFLSNSLNETGPSPRSVLGFAESELEFEHEGDDYDDDGGKCGYEDSLGAESSRARDRLRQLASMVRLNWSDEGWVSVRWAGEGVEEHGTGLEYVDCGRVKWGEKEMCGEASGTGLYGWVRRRVRCHCSSRGCCSCRCVSCWDAEATIGEQTLVNATTCDFIAPLIYLYFPCSLSTFSL